jgi:uncharacterized protein (DUF1499 family)
VLRSRDESRLGEAEIAVNKMLEDLRAKLAEKGAA